MAWQILAAVATVAAPLLWWAFWAWLLMRTDDELVGAPDIVSAVALALLPAIGSVMILVMLAHLAHWAWTVTG